MLAATHADMESIHRLIMADPSLINRKDFIQGVSSIISVISFLTVFSDLIVVFLFFSCYCLQLCSLATASDCVLFCAVCKFTLIIMSNL